MGAWKNLNQQDVYLTSYTAKKNWSVKSGSLSREGIRHYQAATSSTLEYYPQNSDLFGGPTSGSSDSIYHKQLVYNSLAQLYFRPYTSGSGLLQQSSSYETYLESSLNTGSRSLGDRATVFSIPRDKFGTHIEPGSLTFGENILFVSGAYSNTGYVAEQFKLHDDGEGALRASSTSGSVKGSIIYSHGQLVLTSREQSISYDSVPNQEINWKSNLPIYTYNYTVRLADSEFNFTQNPSALTGSDNTLKNNVTGSEFQPYITTVGLYNDSNELIAVGKLGKPLPKSRNTETTIQIKLDI